MLLAIKVLTTLCVVLSLVFTSLMFWWLIDDNDKELDDGRQPEVQTKGTATEGRADVPSMFPHF